MEFHDRGDGVRIAFSLDWGNSPTVVFLPGYGSDMNGEKATRLSQHLGYRGIGFLRVEYSGHGASGGSFDDGTISTWRDEAMGVIDRYTDGPLILVGSSMGGWLALLIALARPDRVVALIGVAPAPDFTEWGMWKLFNREQREALLRDGHVRVRAPQNDRMYISRGMIDDGRVNALLDGPIAITCPVRILHGQKDEQVPWETATRLAELLVSSDVRVVLTKDGDHNLSRESDLLVLCAALDELLLITAQG